MSILFNLLTGAGLESNAMKSGNRMAVQRQSLQEHESLRDPMIQFPREYATAMAMPAGPVKSMVLEQLKNMAEDVERDYPKYWDDSRPRKPVSQSSSWVGDIEYDPESRTAVIQMGDRGYTYVNVAPERMAELLNAPSIGRMLNAAKVPHAKGEIVYHSF